MRGRRLLAACAAAVVLAAAGRPAGAQSSGYVPLLDPAYEDLDALAGAGLVRDILLGERPYSQAAFARFTTEAASRRATTRLSPRLEEALARLARRFRHGAAPSVGAAPPTLLATLADAPARGMRANAVGRGIDADLALLRQHNQGRVVPDGASLAAEAGAQWQRSRLAVEAVGRVMAGTAGGGSGAAQLVTASLRSVWGPVALDVGRTPLLTGFGTHGGALFTDNARAPDQLRLRADRPLRLPGPLRVLGRWQALGAVASLGNNRDQPGSLMAVARLSSRPFDALEVGVTYLNVQGGSGSPTPPWWGERINDLFLFFRRDRWRDYEISDKVMGIDLRLSAPSRQSALYVNAATTDDRDFFRQPAGGYWEDAIWVAGVERRGLGREGRLDLRVEGRHTGPNPHTHHQFTSGVTLDRRVLGDAMGPDSEGLLLQADWQGASHRTRMTLALERYRSDSANAYPPPGNPQAWDWHRLTNGPDELRQRVTLERRQDAGWRGFETTVLLGGERARRFDFGTRTRLAAILQLQLRAVGPRGRPAGAP